ncbi:MAG: hypothetical protein IJJ23_11265, partial [Clostridia bacterium]|nr:hypothetical protein [Clostridia bacterium]
CGDMPDNTMLASTAMMLALYAGQSLVSPVMGLMENTLGLRAGMAICAVCMPLCSLCCFGHKTAGESR